MRQVWKRIESGIVSPEPSLQVEVSQEGSGGTDYLGWGTEQEEILS